jgi:hypothetical protein
MSKKPVKVLLKKTRLINRARWNRSAKDGLRRVKRGNTSGLPWLMMVNLPVNLDG